MIGKTPSQHSLFSTPLEKLVNPHNRWVKLAHDIPWADIETALSSYYCQDNGRPSLPIRLMVGLLLIKQIQNISDEEVVVAWSENIYWQYFCGEIDIQYQAPCVANELTAFRKRIGQDGADYLFSQTVAMHGQQAQEKRTVVDSTVQEKNITYPTDSKLYLRIITRLHRIADQHQLPLRRSFKRELKELKENLRYFNHSNKAKLAKKSLRRLRTITGKLLRDVQRKLEPKVAKGYEAKFKLFHQILAQERSDKNKIYSVHEPDVLCISKGKAHKKYEFGSIATIVRTMNSRVIVGATNSRTNRHDSKLLKGALQHANRHRQKPVQEVLADKGYRGAKVVEKATVLIPGSDKYSGGYSKSTLSRVFKKRAGIEASIGHLKSDFRLSRNYLKGVIGDDFNLLMACCAHNLKLWANSRPIFCFLRKYGLKWRFLTFFCHQIFNNHDSSQALGCEC